MAITVFRFSPVNAITPMHHIHLHVNPTITIMTSGRNLKTLTQQSSFGYPTALATAVLSRTLNAQPDDKHS